MSEARHIVVVPEIEMPGHAGAWLAAYPELAVFPDKAAQLPVRTRWGINPDVLARHVLGAQAQVWGECLASFEAIGYMTFPRACAMAEVCWSQPEAKDLAGFLQRLERHEARLRAIGIPYRPLAPFRCGRKSR